MPTPRPKNKRPHNVATLRWPNPTEREQVRLAAEKVGIPLSAYIRRAAVLQSRRDMKKAA